MFNNRALFKTANSRPKLQQQQQQQQQEQRLPAERKKNSIEQIEDRTEKMFLFYIKILSPSPLIAG